MRAAMIAKMRFDSTSWDNFVHFCGGLGGIQIAGVKPGVGDALLGRRLGDVARAAGVADLDSDEAFAAAFDFFAANAGEIAIISHYGNDATMERFFRRPTMAICTDGLDAGAGTEAASALARVVPESVAHGARDGHPARSKWSGAWRRCRAASSTSPTRRCASAPTRR